jgi:DMSO reductase anchor subunit
MTLPTTHFKTKRVFPRNILPVDYHSVNPQHPHWPLIVMLVLTELSVGAFLAGMFLKGRLDSPAFRQLHALSASGFGLLAIAASITHLGRPRYAFRAFLGLRHSWLSREIVAFGVFAGSACLYALACSVPAGHRLISTFEWTVAVSGLLGLFCSAMVYSFTRRELWSMGRTLTKFALTAGILGISATWLSILVFGIFVDGATADQLARNAGTPLVGALIAAAVVKLVFEASLFRHLLARRRTVFKRSAELLAGPLSSSTFARFACGLLGGIVMPGFLWRELATEELRGPFLLISVGLIFVACLVGELLERYQFFAACAVPRMPGRL